MRKKTLLSAFLHFWDLNDHGTLMKLTPGVNFINVKRTNFLYEHHFSSYILALSKNLYEKRAQKTLMKLRPDVLLSI